MFEVKHLLIALVTTLVAGDWPAFIPHFHIGRIKPYLDRPAASSWITQPQPQRLRHLPKT